MKLFQSIGSNFRFFDALKHLFATGSKAHQDELRRLLSDRYGGEAEIYYKGRFALANAIALATDPGDKVAVNGFTCYVVIQAIKSAGREPVLLDIDEQNLHFGAEQLEKALENDSSIKAVIAQNTLGMACDIFAIKEVANRYDLVLIEDLAHSIGVKYKNGTEAGLVGDLVMLSFGRDKIVDVVNGGALVVRKGDFKDRLHRPNKEPRFIDRLRDRFYPIVSWKARAFHSIGLGGPYMWLSLRLRFISRSADGDIDPDIGLSGWKASRVLSGINALDQNLARRSRILEQYKKSIDGILPGVVRAGLLTTKKPELLRAMEQKGIHLKDTWYDTPIYPERFMNHYEAGSCRVSESVAKQIINLPLHRNVTQKHIDKIIEVINDITKN